MVSKRQSRRRSQNKTRIKDWPEKMNAAQARKFLGVSPVKMTALLTGELPWEWDQLDLRVKLIKRSDLEALLNKRN